MMTSGGYTVFPAYSQILLKQRAFYFKTVIVTADIDEGLAPRAAKRPLALTYADLFYR